ncbi:MAG: potassium-transporting ATPase subunit C [Steroidobacteraceae bacterium]
MPSSVRAVLVSMVLLTVLAGLVYPLLILGLAQAFFPEQADGSLVRRDGRIIGSTLIGQKFDDARYFWGRPSATDRVLVGGLATDYCVKAKNLPRSRPRGLLRQAPSAVLRHRPQ